MAIPVGAEARGALSEMPQPQLTADITSASIAISANSSVRYEIE